MLYSNFVFSRLGFEFYKGISIVETDRIEKSARGGGGGVGTYQLTRKRVFLIP